MDRSETFERETRDRVREALTLCRDAGVGVEKQVDEVMLAISRRLDWPCLHEDAQVRGTDLRCDQCNAILDQNGQKKGTR